MTHMQFFFWFLGATSFSVFSKRLPHLDLTYLALQPWFVQYLFLPMLLDLMSRYSSRSFCFPHLSWTLFFLYISSVLMSPFSLEQLFCALTLCVSTSFFVLLSWNHTGHNYLRCPFVLHALCFDVISGVDWDGHTLWKTFHTQRKTDCGVLSFCAQACPFCLELLFHTHYTLSYVLFVCAFSSYLLLLHKDIHHT